MSGQFSSALMFFSLVAIALAAHQAERADFPAPSSRGPASIEGFKLADFKPDPGLKHTEKLRGPLSVQIQKMEDGTMAIGDSFIVRATILTRRTLDRVEYTWSLPAGVELINGEVKGVLTSVLANQPVNLELTVRKLSEDNLQIHFLAGATAAGARFADAAQLNTEDASVSTGTEAKVENKHSPRIFH